MDLSKLDIPFSGEDLEWKVQTCGMGRNGAWALIVPYVANRAIMSRLDEVVGKLNWRNEFKDLDGKGVECTIYIRCPDTGEWIGKSDAAEQTDIEPVKGGRSNAMKRAAVQWGMGRHLYDVGETWADCSMERQTGKEWNRAKTKDKKEFWWRVPNGQKSQPAKANIKPKSFGSPVQATNAAVISDGQLKRLMAIANEHKVTTEQQQAIVTGQFGFTSRKQITKDKYDLIVAAYETINADIPF